MNTVIKSIINRDPILIDLVLSGIDDEIERLRESLEKNKEVVDRLKGNKLVIHYLSIRPVIKRKIQELHVLKSKIMGLLDKSGMLCKIDLWNDTSMINSIPLILKCRGPRGYCFTTGLLSPKVANIESYDYEVYWRSLGYVYKHNLISDRWLGYSECGHNRAYIREDGALVISHDTIRFDGVHVVHFKDRKSISLAI